MWCDNCLLILPLRAGAMIWAGIMVLYSIAGGIFLFRWGEYLFFNFPEWEIYGGVSMAVAATAIINIVAMSNRSYIWTRVCKALWPFILVVSLVRCIVMMIELHNGQDKLQWECDNGGKLYGAIPVQLENQTIPMPIQFCLFRPSIIPAFVVSLLVDLVFQTYMLFLNWRYAALLRHYSAMKGPMMGGYYNPY